MFAPNTAFATINLFALLTAAIPSTLNRYPSDPSSLADRISTVQLQLGPRLSRGASLSFPNSPNFGNLTARWSKSSKSDFAVVVIPAKDNDVTVTVCSYPLRRPASDEAWQVKFATSKDIPFLAVNRGHGTALDLSNVYHGISIYVSALNSTSIDETGNSATLGGGTYADQVIKFLAAQGKAARNLLRSWLSDELRAKVHSYWIMCMRWYDGFRSRWWVRSFPRILRPGPDNIIEMDVVLADGSAIKVSDSSHPDLFWGMRGAGHNFGIVTKFKYRIYDQPTINWSVATLVFTQDKLEAFFHQLNLLGENGTQPKQLTTYNLFAMNPQISKIEVKKDPPPD